MDFNYNVSEDVTFDFEESDRCVSRFPIGDEVVVVNRDEKENPMILANKEGWLYLARICVEMASASTTDPKFHVHRSSNFESFPHAG